MIQQLIYAPDTKMYNARNLQTMSSDPLRMSDAMLDSLTVQLREAENRRAEAERAHQVRSPFTQFDHCFFL